MPRIYFSCPPREKGIILLDLLMSRGVLTAGEISDTLECHKKTAKRYMWMLYDMQHELENFTFKMVEKKGKSAIKIILDNNI